MRLLFDENMPYPSYRHLFDKGFDVQLVDGSLAGEPDNLVLAAAVDDNRIIVTFDSDFGELVFKQGLKPLGVVYFRWQSFRPSEPGVFLETLLTREEIVLEKNFTVVDRGYLRQRLI